MFACACLPTGELELLKSFCVLVFAQADDGVLLSHTVCRTGNDGTASHKSSPLDATTDFTAASKGGRQKNNDK